MSHGYETIKHMSGIITLKFIFAIQAFEDPGYTVARETGSFRDVIKRYGKRTKAFRYNCLNDPIFYSPFQSRTSQVIHTMAI